MVGWGGGGGDAMAVMDIDFVLLLIVKIIGVICLGENPCLTLFLLA